MPISDSKHRYAWFGFIASHDGVVALRAYEAAFFAVMRAAMGVFVDTIGERHASEHLPIVDVAIEIDPLAAVTGPRTATKGLTDAASENQLLKRLEVFAQHAMWRQPRPDGLGLT
jgi:hypothetical protein